MTFRAFEHAGWERATARYELGAIERHGNLKVDLPPGLFETMVAATVRTGALLRAQTPQALAAIRAEVTAQATTALPMPAVLASATKGSL